MFTSADHWWLLNRRVDSSGKEFACFAPTTVGVMVVEPMWIGELEFESEFEFRFRSEVVEIALDEKKKRGAEKGGEKICELGMSTLKLYIGFEI